MTPSDRLAAQELPICAPYPEIKVWHLVYHLAPFKKKRIRLHYHLEQLRKYSSLFNGRKILSCVTGDAFLPPSYVRSNLADTRNWEIIDAPNSPLHEATSIIRIFDDLLLNVSDQAFMYGHGKGMSREINMNAKWIEYLYKYTFGSFERVNLLLRQYPVAGPFLWRAWSDQQASVNEGWLYPGNFFAARCDVLSRMNWREMLPDSRYWLERLPGFLFHKKYLGNVSNAIFGDTAQIEAIESSMDPEAFEGSLDSEDAFWARFDAALAGQPCFSAETKVR